MRNGRTASFVRGAMRTVAPLVAITLLVGCSTADPTPSTTAPSATTTASVSSSADASPDGPSAQSSEALTPIEMLACDRPVSDVGAAGEEVALQTQGGRTPDDALRAFLETSPWVIPRSGYEPIGSSGDRRAYGYVADGEVKAVVVVSPRFAHLVDARFVVDELRTCASGEFGPNADFGGGLRAWVHPELGTVIHDIVGPGHCEWQSARLMHLQHPDGSLDRQYVRDPNGALSQEPLLEMYGEGVELPPEARDSGYRSPEGFELWFTESDTAAYVVTPDGVERWPRARDPIGCA